MRVIVTKLRGILAFMVVGTACWVVIQQEDVEKAVTLGTIALGFYFVTRGNNGDTR